MLAETRYNAFNLNKVGLIRAYCTLRILRPDVSSALHIDVIHVLRRAVLIMHPVNARDAVGEDVRLAGFVLFFFYAKLYLRFRSHTL